MILDATFARKNKIWRRSVFLNAAKQSEGGCAAVMGRRERTETGTTSPGTKSFDRGKKPRTC